MNKKAVLLFSILALVLSSRAQTVLKDSTFYYQVKPVPKNDRTEIEIEFRCLVREDSLLTVYYPTDYYGVQDLHKYVSRFEVIQGSTKQAVENEHKQVIAPDKNGEIKIKYVLSYDPVALEDYTYSPNVSPTHFHLAFCQFLLRPAYPELAYTWKIDMASPLKGWHFYSSVSDKTAKTEIRESYYGLITYALGGGKQSTKTFSVKGKPVHVFIKGNFTIPDEVIFSSAEKIVNCQRALFNDYDFPFFNITILEKADNIAGTCVPNLFVCFVKKEVSKDQLCYLLSHEMFHVWLGQKMYVRSPAEEPINRFQWVHEGVTDYCARKILLEKGLMSRDAFIESINKDIINIADNPYRNYSLQALCSLADSGKFGQAASKLQYYRGALIALNWESRMDRTKDIFMLVNELYQLSKQSRGVVEADSFYTLGRRFGLDFQADFEKYILRGEKIDVPFTAFSNDYLLEERQWPSFDISFNKEQTVKTRKLTGVDEHGPAYQAGAREGMDYVSIRNTNRFGNNWSAKDPVVLTVKVDGAEKEIRYFPHGKNMSLRLYTKKN